MSRTRCVIAVVWAVVWGLCAWSGCREGAPAASQQRPEAEGGGAAVPAEFRRHLQQGLEQMRLWLTEAAEAEFAQCAALVPDDARVRFHRLRVETSQKGADVGALTEQWEALVADLTGSPLQLRARRVLALVYERVGREEAAEQQWAAVEDRLGPLGRSEMEMYEYLLGRRAALPALTQRTPIELKTLVARGEASVLEQLAWGFEQLRMEGFYDPLAGQQRVDGILGNYPEAVALRTYYALLLHQVHIPGEGTAEVVPLDSRRAFELAVRELEYVLDGEPAWSALAAFAQLEMGRLSLDMGDFEDALQRFALVAEHEGAQEAWRFEARYSAAAAHIRNGQPQRAVHVLEDLLREGLYPEPMWLLHVACEQAGVRPSEERFVFPLRLALRHAPNPTGLSFVDIAERLGVNKYDGAGPSAWGDYDGDGDFDLFVAGCDTYSALYRNDGERFVDVSREAGLLNVQSGFSATFADYDNDGWPDLYIGRDGWSGAWRNSLYHNNGDGTFTEVTDAAGVGNPGSTFVHAWADFDRDGYLDLFLAQGITGDGSVNCLYRNNGDGTFTDITEEAGLLEPEGTKTIGVAVGDYDKDGWPDIFLNSWDTRNRLYRNRGDGTFEEVAAQTGVAGAAHPRGGYCAYFIDYNNDAWPDILLTKLAPWRLVLIGMMREYDEDPRRLGRTQVDLIRSMATKLYRNNGDGTFTDVSLAAGLRYPHGTMGSNVADVDNDGYIDFYLATGDPDIRRMEPDVLYRNTGLGTFLNVTWVTGLGHIGKGHGVTFCDFDHDGDLDMYVPEGGFWHGDLWHNVFYENRMPPGNHWLHVDLEGVRSNRDGVGARLTVRAGDLVVYRERTAGGAFGSSNSPTVEFGLGAHERVDELEIVWPSGERQVFRDLPADQWIFVREGAEQPVPRRADVNPVHGKR